MGVMLLIALRGGAGARLADSGVLSGLASPQVADPSRSIEDHFPVDLVLRGKPVYVRHREFPTRVPLEICVYLLLNLPHAVILDAEQT